jgi:uncharacterized protein YoxC
MIDASASDLALLLVQQPETTLFRQIAPERGWFETVTGIASGLMTLTLLVLAGFLIPAAWNFRKSYKKANDLMDRIQADINPILRHASSIADNVDYVTTTIRADVQRINATVASANQRIQHGVELTEQRLNEFNALLQVVQQEAERLFVSTASTVRGVRTGAAAFRHPAGDDGPELASEADGSTAGVFPASHNELPESSDGDDTLVDGRSGEPGGLPAPTAAPRVRPRPKQRRWT